MVADTIRGADPDPLNGGILIEAEMELLDEGKSGGGGSGPTLAYPACVGREYVYVPSAADGYADEFIGQFDRYGNLRWILQDVNFNVLRWRMKTATSCGRSCTTRTASRSSRKTLLPMRG